MKRLALFVILSFFALQAQVTSYGTLITDPEDYFITKEPHKLQLNLLFIENLSSELMFFKIGDYTWRLPGGERKYFVRMRIPVYATKDPQHKPMEFLVYDTTPKKHSYRISKEKVKKTIKRSIKVVKKGIKPCKIKKAITGRIKRTLAKDDKRMIGTLDIKYETTPGRYFVTATLLDAQGNIIVRRHEYSPKIFNEVDLAIIISDSDLNFTILKLTRARLKR